VTKNEGATMKQGLLVFLLTLLLAARAAIAAAPEAKTPRVEIEDYGIYDASLDPGDKTAGQIVLVKKTWRAPAEPGALFGLRFTLKSPIEKPVELTVRVSHPPIEDPDAGRKVQQYGVLRAVEPGVPCFHGQRLDKDALAAVGRWVFQIFHGETLLAEREFEVYIPEPRVETGRTGNTAPPSKESVAAGFVAKEHGRCRNQDPAALRTLFPGRALVPEQSFALRAPLLGECCFLTLSGATGDAHALLSSQGRVLASFEPWSAGRTKAVSFEDLNGDGLPEIAILTEPQAQGLPNRVYWSLVYGRVASWASHELVDRDIAKLRRASEVFERVKERLDKPLGAGRNP
jgi:hypothetical protein